MLTSDGALALSTILNFAGNVFMTGVPGTSITFLGLFLGILVTCFIIKWIQSFFEMIQISDTTVTYEPAERPEQTWGLTTTSRSIKK